MRRLVLFVLLMALPILFTVDAAADKRPVEGWWEMPDAVQSEKWRSPARYYYLMSDQVPVLFLVDERDAGLFLECDVQYELPQGVTAERDDGLLTRSRKEGAGFRLQLTTPGPQVMSVHIVNDQYGFDLSFRAEIFVVEKLAEIPAERDLRGEDMVVDASPGPVDMNGTKGRAEVKAPANYAHVYGLAATYINPSTNRRFMCRGVRLELRDTVGVIATVHASDQSGEANYGLDFEDYITAGGSYYHVSDSGLFDFGNIYVGAAGKQLWIREYYSYYSAATGYSDDGTLRATIMDGDDGNAEIYQTWNLGWADSGAEMWRGLYNDTWTLDNSNSTLADEAMHIAFDMAKYHRFFRLGTGYSIPYVPTYIRQSDTSSPHHSYGSLYFDWWTNNYLEYDQTDSVRHEYSHATHYNFRDGDWDLRPPGDVNHGNCANSTSVDALIEGWARWVPGMLFRDGTYHWTAIDTQTLGGTSNYCVAPTPDDRHEWAAGRALWTAWNYNGQTHTFCDCTSDALRLDDPIYVQDYFMDIIDRCSFDSHLWFGFNDHSIDYDVTAPANPSPISVSPNRQWTNDSTPTWSWSTPADDISGIDGYSVLLTTTTSQPNTSKNIEEVTSYTPSPLADANAYYLNLRSVDNSGNWASGYGWQGPIGIDTVQPGAVSNLQSTSHVVGQWSTSPSLIMTWTAATDNRSGIDGYGLFTSTYAALPGTTKDIEEVTTYTDTLSSSASGWYFNIRSVDNALNWDSDHVTAGPYYVDNVIPGAVSSLTSTSHTPNVWSSDTTIDFTWTAAADAHSGIDGYGLYWAATTPGTPSNTKDIEEVTSYTQTQGSTTTDWYFCLKAVDNAGNWSSTYVSIGPYKIDATDPTVPTNLTSTSHSPNVWSNDVSVDFTWTAATDAHSGLDGYGFAWSTSPSTLPSASKNFEETATSYTMSGFSSAAGYYFKLRSVDNTGNWDSSFAIAGPYFLDNTDPALVSSLTSTSHTPGQWSNNTTIDFAWTAALDIHSGIDGYGVAWSTSSSSGPANTKDIEAVTTYSRTQSSSSLGYYFSIRSLDVAANWDDEFSVIGPFYFDTSPPAGVTGLASTSHTIGQWSNDSTISFSWTAAADSYSGLDGYGLELSHSSAGAPAMNKIIEEVTTDSRFADSSSQGWYYKLRSIDNAGNWQVSYNWVGPYYVDTVLPGGATSLKSTSHSPGVWSNDTTIDFVWEAATDSHSGIDGYSILWNTSPTGSPDKTKVIEEVTSYTQTASTSASGYYFKLKSVDNAANWQGDYVYDGPFFVDAIAPTAATNLSSPTNPINSCVTDNDTVTVTWTAASDTHAGLSGYSFVWADAVPDTTIDLAAGTVSLTADVGYSANPRYFSIRARDAAANWSTVATYGPFYLDDSPISIGNTLYATQPVPGQVSLAWGSTAEVQYRIERATTPDFSTFDFFTTNMATWTDTTPPVAQCVFYRVVGVNICGVAGS